MKPNWGGTALFILGLGGCVPDFPDIEPPSPTIRRLTAAQYTNSIQDIFGSEVVVPGRLEPDSSIDGFLSIGASHTTISPRGIELYESASLSIVEQVFLPGPLRDQVINCTPKSTVDDECARQVLESYGERLWRRPLSVTELDTLLVIAEESSTELGTFEAGLQYAFSALLQSPHFLFRVELGEPDPDHSGHFRYSDYEMASRLSFFLWNTTPDSELLLAAAAGELTDDEGLEDQILRLMESDRARVGFRNYVDEYLGLYKLLDLKKDPLIFTHMDVDAGPSAREETLMNFESLVFDEDGDYRDILLSKRTFLNRKLASMYDVKAPVHEGYGEVVWEEESPRLGLLTQVSILALNAHAVSTSATLRGKFLREHLLCQELPPPPSDLNTSLPEVSDDVLTLRERVEQHMSDPSCAVCHEMMDPLGLALENFDGIGRHRLTENGELIDPSGDLDGVPFTDAKDLAKVLSESDDFSACFVLQLARYANGRMEVGGESAGYDHLTERFERSKYSVHGLMMEFMVSPAFRSIGGVE